jgi:hypothetical protein
LYSLLDTNNNATGDYGLGAHVLEKEIVKRYYYRKGMYEFYLLKDEDVLAAKQLLNDTKVYLNILK